MLCQLLVAVKNAHLIASQKIAVYLRMCAADAVPVQSTDVGGDAALSSVCGVEVGASSSADNATYCRGVQPITIEPMDCETDIDDVEPLTYAESLPTGIASKSAVRQTANIPDVRRRPSADAATQPAMRVVYCGTVSGEQLLQQNAFGNLTRNLTAAGNSSAPACKVNTSEAGGRTLSHDGTPGRPISVDCMSADTCVVDSSDNGRKAVAVQRRSSDRSTDCPVQQPQSTTDITDAGSSIGRKSTSGSKSRRTQSLDGGPSAVKRRSVGTPTLSMYQNFRIT